MAAGESICLRWDLQTLMLGLDLTLNVVSTITPGIGTPPRYTPEVHAIAAFVVPTWCQPGNIAYRIVPNPAYGFSKRILSSRMEEGRKASGQGRRWRKGDGKPKTL